MDLRSFTRPWSQTFLTSRCFIFLAYVPQGAFYLSVCSRFHVTGDYVIAVSAFYSYTRHYDFIGSEPGAVKLMLLFMPFYSIIGLFVLEIILQNLSANHALPSELAELETAIHHFVNR